MVGCRQHVGRLSMMYRCSKSFSVSAISLLKRQLSCLIRRELVSARWSKLFRRFPARAKVTLNRVVQGYSRRLIWGGKSRDSWKEFNFSCDSWIDSLTWGPFLETPETFWVYFGCCNFLRISKTKTFLGVKFCNKFALSYLEIIVKGQLSRMSGSQFLKWLFGPGKFAGLSRKIRELLVLRTVIRESWVNFRENWESNGNSWSIICFYLSAETYSRNESDKNNRSF